MKSFKVVKLSILVVYLVFSSLSCMPLGGDFYPRISEPGIYHIVDSGENLYRISKAYGVELSEIVRINHIKNPDQIGVGERIFIPRARERVPIKVRKALELKSVEKLVGVKKNKVKWRTITLHHSATREGNAGAFDLYHRRKRMGGLAYHFVIGNGRGSRNGQIEVGWRWTRQVQSCRKRDIQICVVGDFTKQHVSSKQFESMLKLVSVLSKQYNIPAWRIRRHNDIKGKTTKCPGHNFPFYKLLAELKKIN